MHILADAAKARVTPRNRAIGPSSERMDRTTARIDARIDAPRIVALAGTAGRDSSAAVRHRACCAVVDEHLLKLTMPGRAYTGALTSGTVDRARHAIAVGDAALRAISAHVVLPRTDTRGLAAASVDTRAFVRCLLPWVLRCIDSAG